ncbi:hypothetical protein [Helicobacter pylori]|uniref:hypothetical protein n=1 Tax=Helicobacter pylori TaxID=210 RepID=UPI001F099DE4|nr:hypothetical protein [Helicobacter pylori]
MNEELNTKQDQKRFKKLRLLGSVMTYGIMVYGGLNLINTMLLPTEYKHLGSLGFEKMVSLYQRFQGKEVQKQGSELVFNKAVEEKLKSDRVKAMQIQKNIEALEKGSKKPPTKNPFDNASPTQPPKILNDNPFDSAMDRIEQQVHQKNSLKATINQCVAMGNSYNELRSCLATNIKDPKILDPMLQKVQKFEQEANEHSRNFNHLSNIMFASNDNDFRNYAILVSEQEATPRPKIENPYMKAMEDELKKTALAELKAIQTEANAQEKAKNNPKLTEKNMRFIDRALTEMANCSRRHSHLDDKKVQSICKPNYPNKTFNDYLIGITKIFKICQKKGEPQEIREYEACLISNAKKYKTPETLQYIIRFVKAVELKFQEEQEQKE